MLLCIDQIPPNHIGVSVAIVLYFLNYDDIEFPH